MVRQVGPEPVLEVVHEGEEESGEQRGRDADRGSEPDELEVRGAAEVVLLFGQAPASLRPNAGGLRLAEPLRQPVEDRDARLERTIGRDRTPAQPRAGRRRCPSGGRGAGPRDRGPTRPSTPRRRRVLRVPSAAPERLGACGSESPPRAAGRARRPSNCTCAASDHSVWPNGVKPARRTCVSTLVAVSPAEARTSSTAAAAASGGPRRSHRASEASLSETISAASISSSSRSPGLRAATASASGTLIVDQATPPRIVPSSSTDRPAPIGATARPTPPSMVDWRASKPARSSAVTSKLGTVPGQVGGGLEEAPASLPHSPRSRERARRPRRAGSCRAPAGSHPPSPGPGPY